MRDASVTRQWPHEVRIEVEERTAVAVIQMGDQLRSLDGDGVIFGSLRRAPDDLPRVQSAGGTSSDALREAATVASALEPAFLATVDHLEVETVDRITLALRDGRLVRWGSAEESDRKAEVLSALLSQAGGGLRRERARLAHHRSARLTGATRPRRPEQSQPVASATACRRHRGPDLSYCRAHDEVDITITLRLRVRVQDQGQTPSTSPSRTPHGPAPHTDHSSQER